MVEFLRKFFGRDRQVHAVVPLGVEPRRHDMPMVPPGSEDIITGWRFCATMQMRTPLAILRQHNHLVPATSAGPPQLTSEMWQGIWLPDLGSEWRFLDEGASMASEIGPIPSDGGDYLPFLIAVRTISEGSGTVAEMEKALRALIKECGPGGTPYSKFHSGRALVDRVLPRTIHLLPAPAPVREHLLADGYKTLARVQAATDDALLAIKGLGPKSLGNIRGFLTTTTADLHAERYLAQELGAVE